MNAANGTAITEKEVLKEVAKLSSAIQSYFIINMEKSNYL
jgi:hypothetical protein